MDEAGFGYKMPLVNSAEAIEPPSDSADINDEEVGEEADPRCMQTLMALAKEHKFLWVKLQGAIRNAKWWQDELFKVAGSVEVQWKLDASVLELKPIEVPSSDYEAKLDCLWDFPLTLKLKDKCTKAVKILKKDQKLMILKRADVMKQGALWRYTYLQIKSQKRLLDLTYNEGYRKRQKSGTPTQFHPGWPVSVGSAPPPPIDIKAFHYTFKMLE
jgi:hypothetical protein